MAMMIFNGSRTGDYDIKPWELKAIPKNVLAAALMKMAEKARTYVRNEVVNNIEKGSGYMNRAGYSESAKNMPATTANAIIVKSQEYKGSPESVVTWKGTRRNGRGTKRTAEVAFLNEYGAPNHIEKRMFISKALDKANDDIDAIIEDLILNWIERKGA